MRRPPDLNVQASLRVMRAVRGLRGAKTSIAKGRTWLPACDIDIELNLEVRKIREIELSLMRLARKLEATPRYARDPDVVATKQKRRAA